MKSTSARGACLAILLASLASTAWCQDLGQPSLLPMPLTGAGGYPVAPASAYDAIWGQPDPSPIPQVGNIQSPMQAPLGSDYMNAMKGGYDGYSACGPGGCCSNHYVYANALVMTHIKQGGFVPAVDSGT